MNCTSRYLVAFAPLMVLLAAGCQSPYHADRGALFGGLLGAGTGAIVGDALGNTGAGAAIGAGVGALTGAAIGQGMDEVEANNRAMIAAQLGREIRSGAVTFDDVVMMTQAGVDEELIVTHIRRNGMTRVPNAQDLISLQQQGVSVQVVKTMQEPPQPRQAKTVVVREPSPPPVIVEEHYYQSPFGYAPRYRQPHYRHQRPGPPIGWGVTFHN